MLLFSLTTKTIKKYFRSRGKFRQAGPDRAAETAVADALRGLAWYMHRAAFTNMSIALLMTKFTKHENQQMKISIKIGFERRAGQAGSILKVTLTNQMTTTLSWRDVVDGRGDDGHAQHHQWRNGSWGSWRRRWQSWWWVVMTSIEDNVTLMTTMLMTSVHSDGRGRHHE